MLIFLCYKKVLNNDNQRSKKYLFYILKKLLSISNILKKNKYKLIKYERKN